MKEQCLVRANPSRSDKGGNAFGANVRRRRPCIRPHDDAPDHRAYRVAPTACTEVEHWTATAGEAICSGAALKLLDEPRLPETGFTAHVDDAASADLEATRHGC